MENKLFFSDPLIRDIMCLSPNGVHYFLLKDVVKVFEYNSIDDAIKFCCDPIKPFVGNQYVTLNDFFRLVINAPHADLVRFTNNLFETILPNLPIGKSSIKDNAIINICGLNMYQYFIESGRLDELVSIGGIWLKNEYHKYRTAHPSTDSNVTRTFRKFESNLIKLLSIFGYHTEYMLIKGVRYLSIFKQ